MAALPIFGAGACTGASGTTPDCKSDVTDAGIQPTKGGCSGFAPCLDDKGQPADAKTVCCKDLEGVSLENCLFGYGAASAPTGSSSASGGGGGAGGAGGGGAGGGGAGGGSAGGGGADGGDGG
jgi:hypothetical protein